MKVLIPMAGEGSRFANAGYTFPKPLIDVNGKPMIQTVVENIGTDATYVFLVRSEHLVKYEGLRSTLERITSNNNVVVEVQELTQGAACTALLAERFIDNDEDLLIANSDQYVAFNHKNFETMRNHCSKADGLVFTFNATHPKWSFVKVNDSGEVTRVEEKNPISDIATCGIYWYRKGSDFVRYAHRMIEKNIRTNNEFYIAPVYNEMLLDNKTVFPFFVEKMWGLGTPEDLDYYLRNFKG